MNNWTIVLSLLMTTSLLVACDKAENTQNARLTQEWQTLDFDDWVSKPSGVLSSQDYQNFRLEGEFFLAESQQNQMLIGAAEGSGQAFSEGGLSINLDHNPDQQNTLGTIVDIARATVLEDIPTKAWNKIAISVLDKTIEVRINDQMVTATQLDQGVKGKIGFVAAQDLVSLSEQFRNFKIKVLSDDLVVESVDIAVQRTIGQKNAKPILAEDMEGWHRSGTGTWSLEEGILTGESGAEGGYLISDSLYKNFYLSTRFKIAKEDNSGIFVRLHPDSSNISAIAGIECNIYDHNGFSHAFSTGSIVARARAFSNLIDYEDWNQMEILAIDNQVVLYVNGRESADHAFPAGMYEEAGHIALQAGIKVFLDKSPSTIQFKEMRFTTFD